MSACPPMKTIPVTEAVGTVLCHDITRIEVGGQKGPLFRKGHVVREEDIPLLLRIGKENLYVFSPQEGMLHEDDAARRIGQAVAGANITFSEIKEGRINLIAACHGLLRIDVPVLTRINSCDAIALASLHTMQEVQKGQAVAGTRVIPLMIEEDKIAHVESLAQTPLIEVLPFRALRVGMVTTGSEVYAGRIKDTFGPVLRSKFEALGSSIIGQTLTDDSVEMTATTIGAYIDQGAQMIVCTGGMSVDPDDRTPAAIRAAGGAVVTYGAPVFPGAMFLLAYIGDIPILGLPVSREDITMLGHGGYCESCSPCRYPQCAFGKY